MQNGRPDFLKNIIESDKVRDKIGEIESIEELDEGLNSIFLLEASERYILKVHTNPRNDIEWFRAEPLIYSRLEGVDIPSPEIVYSELDEELHENAFFIMEEMRGVNPAGFKEEIDFQVLDKMMNNFGRFLGEIHENVEMKDYGMLGGFDGEIRSIKSIDKWTSAVKGAMRELDDLIAEGWEEDLELEFPSEKEINELLPERPNSVLLHLDNRLDNLLVDGDEVTAFLDWSHPEAGHYEYDLVRAEYLLVDMDLDFLPYEKREKLRNSIYEGYKQVRPLEDQGFEERRKIYRKITLMWVLAGFPNWKSKLSEKERKQKKKYLMEKAEREL
jgi:aminoglycoside phosphotransferase (APT) family kinase protein